MSSPVQLLCRPNHKVVTVDHSDAPADCIAKLLESHIMSAPCRGANGKFIGFIDLRDFVSLVCATAKARESEWLRDLRLPAAAGNLTKWALEAKMFEDPTQGFTTLYLARRNTFVSVAPDTPLETVGKLLQSNKRVAVCNEAGEILDIVSQSMFVKFIQTTRPDMVPDTKVDGMGSSPVIAVKASDSALDAFNLMDKNGIRGLAVVGDKGQIVGNTSASDLRLCLSDFDSELLQAPIFDYLAKIRRMDISTTRKPVITIHKNDTLAMAFARTTACRLHRLFVVDDNHTPVSVLTLTDLIRSLPLASKSTTPPTPHVG